ncbi:MULTISPECIES: Na+/H+ antiporter subunit E [unclassified Solwaraspora]|uniref:Na+/H+ antiporter subunit E n=1 Tax=unclassified Solwaraspora TaxID=2627926 RepID=UPI00259BD0F2|nr:Na+/H+ antiporter subunit E [Solwaraspora sp. WMMA2056]WJK38060.1 Na+/H+ antiporter subunit E [Solwaraspora sp. WMMA2056]
MSGRGGTGTGWRASLPGRFALRAVRVSRFIGYFAVRLVVANLVVAREIVTPGSGLSPGIVEIRLRTRTPTEVVLMALAVGLTPGTLTVAIRQDPPTLFVHGMHAEDPQTFRAELARLQDRMLPAVRPVRDTGDRSGERSGDHPGDVGDQVRPEVNPS